MPIKKIDNLREVGEEETGTAITQSLWQESMSQALL
jgi:hypothetical protein